MLREAFQALRSSIQKGSAALVPTRLKTNPTSNPVSDESHTFPTRERDDHVATLKIRGKAVVPTPLGRI
jgi:hypothetical protein